MNYLIAQQVLFLHALIIKETGGAHGVRDVGLLEAAVNRPRASYGGRDLYPDISMKAASLMDSLIHSHPFVDGNKRTGIAAAALFMRQNGLRLVASNAEIEAFTVSVAESRITPNEMASWLRAHSTPAAT